MRISRLLFWILLINLILTAPSPIWATDLREGVEQLAVQLGKSVPPGRPFRIAVTDFPDLQGVTSDLGRYIAERMTTRLSAQTQQFRVIERRRLNLVLGELKFSISDLVDPNKAKQLGRMLGVEALVVGTVSDLGNQVDVDARIIEIETNNVLPGVSVTISKDQVVSEMIKRGIAVGATPGPATTPTPPSPGGRSPTSQSIAAVMATTPRTFNVQTGKYVGSGSVQLDTVEIFGSELLRFNLTYRAFPSGGGDLMLDQPVENTIVTDDRGRRYGLIEATGISGDRPVPVPGNGQKKFSLLFPIQAEGIRTFKLEVLIRIGESRDLFEWQGRMEGFR